MTASDLAKRAKEKPTATPGNTIGKHKLPLDAAFPSTTTLPGTAAERAAQYEVVALVLQGGGALGAYQAGVYEALHEAGIRPNWVAGTSIGAINASLIGGNPPERRIERLRGFWEMVSHGCTPADSQDTQMLASAWFGNLNLRRLVNFASAAQAVVQGQRGFFTPRFPPPWLRQPGSEGATSFYDTAPLRETLRQLVDFDYLNNGEMRISLGAVEAASANVVYFDSDNPDHRPLTAEHVMASGALPPAFPPVKIGGRYYWDGGLVSNTPLEYVLESEPRHDTLAFQVDLWSALGPLPQDILEVFERDKDIRYSSRTRKGTRNAQRRQNLRRKILAALQRIPRELHDDPAIAALTEQACSKIMNVIHLIYQAKEYESHAKDYEFSSVMMREHWAAGRTDALLSIAEPHYLDRPSPDVGVITHDIHRGVPPRWATKKES